MWIDHHSMRRNALSLITPYSTEDQDAGVGEAGAEADGGGGVRGQSSMGHDVLAMSISGC